MSHLKIVALDLATQCGVAIGEAGSDPISYSVDLGKGRSEDARFSKVLHLTHTLLMEHKPDLLAVEAAIGGRNASAYLIGLVACVRGCAANRGVPCETFHSGSIRKHFVGKAYTSRDFPGLKGAAAKRAIKNIVMDRCKLLGWSPVDDNAADALALLDFAHATKSKAYQAKPLGGLF